MIRSNPLDRASTSVPCAMRAHGLCARDVPNNAVVRKKESRSFDLNDLERYHCAWAELPFEFSTHLSLSLAKFANCQAPTSSPLSSNSQIPSRRMTGEWVVNGSSSRPCKAFTYLERENSVRADHGVSSRTHYIHRACGEIRGSCESLRCPSLNYHAYCGTVIPGRLQRLLSYRLNIGH